MRGDLDKAQTVRKQVGDRHTNLKLKCATMENRLNLSYFLLASGRKCRPSNHTEYLDYIWSMQCNY